MLHHPARAANFVVLRSFDTPSVLVEMGFMSNEADERLLQSDGHRAQVVAALCGGIESCMDRLILPARAG
jgi:N-acetylmuramoyl-L-alanine amidase